MKVIVIGASGFLGSYFGIYLKAKGCEYAGVSRSPIHSYEHLILSNEIINYADLIRDYKPDVVINAIAITSHEVCECKPEYAYWINSVCPAMWAKAAKNVGSMYVQISTDAVFEGKSRNLYTEYDVTDPKSVYGQSKLYGEHLVISEYSDALIIRTNFFGWSVNSNQGILDFFVKSFTEQNTIIGFCDYVVSSLYIGDLCDSIFALLDMRANGIYHVASVSTKSKYEFGLDVGLYFGLDTQCMTSGYLNDMSSLSLRGKNLGLSTEKISNALGRPMPDLASGLKKAIKERSAIVEFEST